MDVFRRPKARLDRVSSDLARLVEAVSAYNDAVEWDRGVVHNPTKDLHLSFMRRTDQIPDRLQDDVVQIVEGMRAVLDGAAMAAAVASGRPEKDAQFPIAETMEKLRTTIIGRGKCRNIPVHVLDKILELKPTKEDTPEFWMINRLANGSKHGLLVPFASAVSKWKRMSGETGDGSFSMPMKHEYIEEEGVFIYGARHPKSGFWFDITLYPIVCFSEFGLEPSLAKHDALQMLDWMKNAVVNAVTVIETATVAGVTGLTRDE